MDKSHRIGSFEDGRTIVEAMRLVGAREAGPHIERFIQRVVAGEFGHDLDLMTATVALSKVFLVRHKDTKPQQEAERIVRGWAGFAPRVRGAESRYDIDDPTVRSEGFSIAQRYMAGEIDESEAVRELGRIVAGNAKTRTALLYRLCMALMPKLD